MLTFVTRSEWRARNPKSVTTIPLPTPELWLHHTAGSERGHAGMRAIQDYHMDVRGYYDIAYSFVVDPDSLKVYVGRGPGIQGGHTEDHNSISHAICVMGNFDVLQPSNALLRTLAELINHGIAQGWWRGLSGGHRDASGASTACPGKYLYAEVNRIRLYQTANGSDDVTEDQMDQLGDWMQEQRVLTQKHVDEKIDEVLVELRSNNKGSIKRKLNRLLDNAGIGQDA